MNLVTYAIYVNGKYRTTVASRVRGQAVKLALSAAMRIKSIEKCHITIK